MKNNYRIAIQWNHTSNTFFAYAPEFDGCIADGATFSEAIENIHLLIEECMMTTHYPSSVFAYQPYYPVRA